jgi:[ribosomal protein S18]-alanine N-acetyltransferase
MSTKRVEQQPRSSGAVPILDPTKVPNDLKGQVKFTLATDADMSAVSALRAGSDPWKTRGETLEQATEALAKIRPFIHVGKLQTELVGYVSVERDGPVPGAAYMRNIVVKQELRGKGLGTLMLNHAVDVAKDMYRKTLALRVDPSNESAVTFYRNTGFTTVATVVSKKSGKLRLLMSREL